MVMLKVIPINMMIDRTILSVTYKPSKGKIIFILDDGLNTMIRVCGSIALNTLFTKNRHFVNFYSLVNISIKDIGWDGYYLFILDTIGNVYRVPTYKNIIYNYSEYKLQKEEAKRKTESFKIRVASIFNKNKRGYDSI